MSEGRISWARLYIEPVEQSGGDRVRRPTHDRRRVAALCVTVRCAGDERPVDADLYLGRSSPCSQLV